MILLYLYVLMSYGGIMSTPKQIDLDQLQKLVEYGHSERFIKDFFGIKDHTWASYKIKYPNFKKALDKWKDTANEHVEKALYERAKGFEHKEEKVFCYQGEITTHETIKQYPPDVAAISLWLRNKDPEHWKEMQALEVSGGLSDMILQARKRIKKITTTVEDILE